MNINLIALLFCEYRVFFQPLIETATIDNNGKITVDKDELKTFLKSIGYDLVLPEEEFWKTIKNFVEAVVALNHRVKDITPLLGKTLDSIDFPNDIKSLKLTIKELPTDTQGLVDFYGEIKPDIDKLINGYNALKGYYEKLKEINSDPDLTAAIKRLPIAAFNALTYRYLNVKHHAIMPSLELLGLAEWLEQTEYRYNNQLVVVDNVPPRYHLQKVKTLFRDPGSYLSGIYWPNGYGTTVSEVNDTAQKLFPLIQEILESFGAHTHLGLIPSELGIVYPPEITEEMKQRMEGTLSWQIPIYDLGTDQLVFFGASLGLLADDSTDNGPGIFILPFGNFAFHKTIKGWLFQLSGAFQNAGFKINKNGIEWFTPAAQQTLDLSLTPPQNSKWVLGEATRLEIGKPGIKAALVLPPSGKAAFDTYVDFSANEFIIDNNGSDFFSNLLGKDSGGGHFNLQLGWDQINKFYIKGRFEITINLNFTIFHFVRFYFIKLKLDSPKLQIGIKAGIVFPPSLFQPIDEKGNIIPNKKSEITLELTGEINTSGGKGFEITQIQTFSFTKSTILNTGFTLQLKDVKLDLSHAKNIPEADADGRPVDFIGVYMKEGTIGFPTDWILQEQGTTGELYLHNLLAGTGGVSGTIGLRAFTTGNPSPIIKVELGTGFEISLNAFDLTFQQNAIIESKIHGKLKIRGFKLKDAAGSIIDTIDVDIHIGTDGEFAVVASAEPPTTALHLENVFDFHIKSLYVGRKPKASGGAFYIGLSGDIDFTPKAPIDKFLPDKVDIKKLIIYDDGKYEFEGGSIVLPKAFELKLGPAKIGVTAIHLGSFEKEGRKYKYFGFDGGVNVNPGGVDVRGKGVKFYYTVDGPYTDPGHEFKCFIRLESLAIDIIIPGSSDPKDAAVIIKGYLSIKDPKIPTGTQEPLLTLLKNATEYAGGVYISIPKFKGLEASASMRFTPQVPAFIIDLGIEISTPILLGTTGLGIYGFRAIFGKRYVATKSAAGIPDDGEWWQYYKAKIDPDYKEGIQLSKFDIKEGFSVGAGVSLATSSDSGKTFSSKLFFLLSLPDVFLFQGQAQFLKDRIGLDAVPDPPFFAIIAITKKSIEAGFGINYKIPEDTGALVTVDGVTELGFFFGDSAAWYFNIGRESPDSMRIQARLFDILNMYFYFMISNSGIRAGAGVSIALKKSFGPLSAELSAYLDTKGRIAFRPKQFGGALQMGGTVALKCCGFGFSVSGGATLAGEAPKPHIITGEFEVCVKVLRKERCAHFEFTWNFEKRLNEDSNAVLVDVDLDGKSNIADIGKIAKATHMVTGETLNLAYAVLNDGNGTSSSIIPDPDLWIEPDKNANSRTLGYSPEDPDDYRIPVDSFIDIEFKKGLNVVTASGKNLNKIGGISSPCEYIEFVPPQRGKSDRVRHEYFLEEIEIRYWDENSKTWEEYDFYQAMKPLFPAGAQVSTCIDPVVLQDMKWGYWQQQRPGYNNKLRILATTPLSYAAKTGTLPIEDLGVNGGTILCPGKKVRKTCIVFDRDQVNKTFTANTLHSYKGITFKITTKEGRVLNNPYSGVDNGLAIQPGDAIELFFNEPMKFVNLLINSGAPSITVGYYTRTRVADRNEIDGLAFSGGLPVFQYDLIESIIYNRENWAGEIKFSDDKKNIDYIKITSKSCYETPILIDREDVVSNIICLNTDEQIAQSISDLRGFIAMLVKMQHFAAPNVQLNRQYSGIYDGVYMGTSLYPNQNYQENLINLVQGYISGTTLLFTISDELGYSCNYSFELVRPIPGFSFANIRQVVSVEPYTTGATAGINYSFLLTVRMNVDGVDLEVEIIGKSCLPTAYCYDRCSSFLYRVCYLPYTDHLLNQTIPSTVVQQANTDTLLDGINKTLQPIWRPNTTFAIRLKTSDKLYAEGSSTPLRTYNLDMVYGFKTAGPVGHYHHYPVDNVTAVPENRQDFNALEIADRTDDFKLLSLKYYIDFPKCYPNADGDILNAKPLFYINAELRLFYLYNHVYEFYNDWKNPNDLTKDIAKSSLAVVIQDPLDSDIEEENPSLSFVGNSIPHTPAQIGLPPVNINNINNDINILNNILLNGGNPCATPGTSFKPLAPIDISTKKTLDLKPLKLYTAQFVAKYNPLIMNPTTKVGEFATKDYESVVHSYVFQTSRYSSFAEQVESYILKKDSSGTILREAVFVMDIAPIDPNIATAVITNNEGTISDALKLQYADPFDRLINGVLKLDYNRLHAAVTTEFNIIRSSGGSLGILGFLIRNPEPFNDPKLPPANPNNPSVTSTETLEVSKWDGNNWGSSNDYYVIHSKDRSRMFVTERNMNFNIDKMSKLKFTFRYKLYNGVSYADASVVEVIIDLSSYTVK